MSDVSIQIKSRTRIRGSLNLAVLLTTAAITCVVIFFSLINKSFLKYDNLISIMLRMSILGPIAIGIMLTLIVKGIDLSSGATVGLIGIVLAIILELGYPLWLGIIAALLIGGFVGSLNALFISRFNMNPFISTLSVMFIGNSVERVLTKGGLPIYLYGDSSGLSDIYRKTFVGIPIPIIFFLIIAIFLYIFLENTIFGRKIYASGNSIKGSINAGIHVRFYYALVYVLASLLTAISACFVASQVQSGQPLVGQSYLWDAIGAAYLSCIVSKDKKPHVPGTIMGVTFLTLLSNGLTMIGMAFYWKIFFRGILILFILLVAVSPENKIRLEGD